MAASRFESANSPESINKARANGHESLPPKRLALAVHGVGDPKLGEIASPLRTVLGSLEAEIGVDEHNWNQQVGRPDLAEFLFFVWYVIELFHAAMEAVCQPIVPKHRKLRGWTVFCGRCVETLAPAQAVLVPFPIYLLVLWPWGLPPQMTIVWMAWLLGAVFVSNALLGLLSGNREVFWGCFRAGLLPSLWTPLVIFLLVTLIPWPVVAAIFGYLAGYFEAVHLLYPGFSLQGLLEGTNQPQQLPGFFMKMILEVVFFIGAVPVFFLAKWLWEWFYETAKFQIMTKVLADIFLYLGNADYRKKVRAGAVRKFRESLATDVDELVICAHSLGTVVSADALALMEGVQAPKTVKLITAGSPLHRTFWRFFPALFPPPRELAAALKAKHAGFQWVNVHRRLDYVGTHLGLAPEGVEASTGQWWPMHTNYWGDPVPAGKVRELLAKAGSNTAAGQATPANLPRDSDGSTGLQRAILMAGLAVLISLAALVVVGGVRFVQRTLDIQASRSHDVEDYHSATDKRPTVVKVRYFPQDWSGGWLAEQMGMAMNIRIMSRNLADNLPNLRLVNSGAVAKLAEAQGSKVTPATGMAYFEADLPGIEVASNPRLFTIDGAPAKSGAAQTAWLIGVCLVIWFAAWLYRQWEKH